MTQIIIVDLDGTLSDPRFGSSSAEQGSWSDFGFRAASAVHGGLAGLSSRLAPVSDARVSLVRPSIGLPVSRAGSASVAAARRAGQSLPDAAGGWHPSSSSEPSSVISHLRDPTSYSRDSIRHFQLLSPTDAALGSTAPPQTSRTRRLTHRQRLAADRNLTDRAPSELHLFSIV